MRRRLGWWLLVAAVPVMAREGRVTVYKDIGYQAGSTDKGHRLDLYLPAKGAADAPVLVMVHGGAWISGSKEAYEPLARNFAGRGVVAVVPEYRLSPGVRHPDHADDLREALRWIAAQTAKYGFSVKRVFLLGHSAGAHMSAWIAAEPGKPPVGAAGFIGISGIYDVPKLDVRWPGYDTWFLNAAFGPRGPGWVEASPARKKLSLRSPWLLLHGEGDDLVDTAQSENFAAHLKEDRIPATLHLQKGDHYAPLLDLGTSRNPATELILKFLGQ